MIKETKIKGIMIHTHTHTLSPSRVGYRGDEPSVRRAEASARPNPPYTLLWTETAALGTHGAQDQGQGPRKYKYQ